MSAWTSGLQIDGNAGTQMYADFRNLKIDGYDLLIVQEALKDGSLPILTDDFDYVSVPKLSIYTANSNAILAAKEDGKLRR
jgi:hypothetical protein